MSTTKTLRIKKYDWCSRMKLGSAESTSQSTAGVKRVYDHPCRAIISANTGMLMELSNLLQEIHFSWFFHTAILIGWTSFLMSCPSDSLMTWFCCAVTGAAWHKAKKLQIPKNIELFYIPPYTPEMNPIEQIWKELRKLGFRNEVFATLEKVVDRLCDTICALTNDTIKRITGREWIINCFN